MRVKLLFFVFLFVGFISIYAKPNPSHYLTYFVYHQRVFSQGNWIHANQLRDNGVYLEAYSYEDLLGSEKIDLAYKIFELLEKDKPEAYAFSYELDIVKDNFLILSLDSFPENWNMVRNELTASLLVNGFRLIFKFPNQSIDAQLSDLKIPYFDLVENNVENSTIIDSIKLIPIERIIVDTCYTGMQVDTLNTNSLENLNISDENPHEFNVFWWILVATLIASVGGNLFFLFRKN